MADSRRFLALSSSVFTDPLLWGGREYSHLEAAIDIAGMASFASRVFDEQGVYLDLEVRETRPLSVRFLMKRWGWKSTATVARFLSSLETRSGTLTKHRTTRLGNTYLVGTRLLAKCGETPNETPNETGSETPSETKSVEVEKNLKNNSPPTGESAERGNRLKPVKVRRTPLPMTDDWAPSADTVRLAEALHVNLAPFLLDFRGYWMDRGTRRADWDATCRARIEACASSGKFLLNGNGNGSHRPAQTDLLSTDAMKRLAEREAGEVPPYDPSQRWKSVAK